MMSSDRIKVWGWRSAYVLVEGSGMGTGSGADVAEVGVECARLVLS